MTQEQERPCIHVSLLPGTDDALYRWVQIGAEEEGVPCRLVTGAATDLIALAYEAAQSSRFHIGVGVSPEMVALHEMHMPPEKPVMALKFSGQPDYFCRMMGANAARMVVRKPFRFADESGPLPTKQQPHPSWAEGYKAVEKGETASSATTFDDPAQIAAIVALVIKKVQERGV
jgi:hypothetical protein